MNKKVFIQSNSKQILGAYLAKYAIEKQASNKDFSVHIINVDDLNIFKDFAYKKYLRSGQLITYDPNDLQSFTLTRFMPPELMNYEGRAIVIDPDIFALSDINALFSLGLGEKSVAACKKKGTWDSSVMLLDCSKLRHWKIGDILNNLKNEKLDYTNIMTLHLFYDDILEIPRIWNSLDYLDENTKFLHTTNRLTQPWKTGLAVDFTRKPLPKLLGIIPREPILRLMGRYPMTYQPHPDSNIEEFFFNLVKEAVRDNFISIDFIKSEIEKGHIRKDFLSNIDHENK